MTKSPETARELKAVLIYLICLAVLLLLVFYFPKLSTTVLKSGDKKVQLSSTWDFREYLAAENATLGEVRNGSPALDFHSTNLPGDLALQPSQLRMSQFISLVLSPVLKCNEKILAERKRLTQFVHDIKRGRKISQQGKEWLRRLAARYKVPQATPEELLERVDIIPVSLAIAQAITESGWGTSRFAQQGNALFGQHLSRKSKGKYLVSRFGGVKVAAFDSVLQCTSSYMHNLNTAKAYAPLRKLRAELREQGKIPDGFALAAGLLYYSEIGEKYVADLRYLMNRYDLGGLEKASLNRKMDSVVISFIRDETTTTAQTDTQTQPDGQDKSSS